MKILIIRHADPDYTIDSLTEKGWREATFLAEHLADAPIDDFYTSPLGRARDTASLTLKKHQKDAEVLHWLREFDGRIQSPFTGTKRISWDLPPSLWCRDPLLYDFEKWTSAEVFANSNVEQIYRETTKGIDELLERYGWIRDGMAYKTGEDKTIALFCHFGMGITVLSYLLGFSPVIAQQGFFLAPSSVTTLVTETDRSGLSHFRAIGVGDVSHLSIGGEPISESGLYPNFER